MNSFINRTISGVVILLITVLCVYFKGLPLILYTSIVTGLCMIELLNSFDIKNWIIKILSLIFAFFTIYAIKINNIYILLIIMSLYFIVFTFYYLFSNGVNFIYFTKLIFSYIYISIPMGIFLKIGNFNSIWFVYIISWGTDTSAYLVGSLIGKHKLCPSISPKKTIEGSLGGIFGAVLLSNIFNYFIFNYSFLLINLMAIFVSILAEIGDLLASKIKREFGIKDFGNIISGHGGFLDRFDSIIFVTPMVYTIFYVFGGIM